MVEQKSQKLCNHKHKTKEAEEACHRHTKYKLRKAGLR